MASKLNRKFPFSYKPMLALSTNGRLSVLSSSKILKVRLILTNNELSGLITELRTSFVSLAFKSSVNVFMHPVNASKTKTII